MKKRLLYLLVAAILMPLGMQAQVKPAMSEGATDKWYYIKTQRKHKDHPTANAVTAVEATGLLEVAAPEEGNENQMWKLLKFSETQFQLVSKSGFFLGFDKTRGNNEGRVIVSKEDLGGLFEVVEFAGWAEAYQLRVDGIVDAPTFINKCNNLNDGNAFTTYGVMNDGGNELYFFDNFADFNNDRTAAVTPFDAMPKLSSGENVHWYQIEICRKEGKVYADKGLGQAVGVEDKVNEKGEAQNLQLFKFVGISARFKVVTYSGRELKYFKEADGDIVADAYRLVEAGQGDEFSFADGAGQRANSFGICNNDAGSYWNDGGGVRICHYGLNDSGSVFFGHLVENPTGLNQTLADFSVFQNGNTLTVAGENIANVVVYNVLGISIADANGAAEFTLAGGYYIAKITFADGKTVTRKISVK